MNQFTVQHTGYPVAGRPIRPDEWQIYTLHNTESAAWKSVAKATAHLQPGQWDDHYRVLGPDGDICDHEYFIIRSEAARTLGRLGGSRTSARKAASSAANGRKGGRPLRIK